MVAKIGFGWTLYLDCSVQCCKPESRQPALPGPVYAKSRRTKSNKNLSLFLSGAGVKEAVRFVKVPS